MSTKYVYLHHHVLAEVSGATVTYEHTDGVGSPVAQTNSSGMLLNRTRYEPYGAVASGNAGTIGFTGHVNDNDTGLLYMQQRYYDSAAGRFLNIDPVMTDANTGSSFNRYAYVNNSPGVAALTLVGALGKAVIGGPKPASLPQQNLSAAMRTLKQIAKDSKVPKAEKTAPPPPPPPKIRGQ